MIKKAKTSLDGLESFRLLTINTIEEITGLGRTKIYEEIASGKLRIVKVGRRSLITPKNYMMWMDSLESPHGANDNEPKGEKS